MQYFLRNKDRKLNVKKISKMDIYTIAMNNCKLFGYKNIPYKYLYDKN